MKRFFAAFVNEFEKLLSRKKYIVLLVISALFCIGRVGINLLVDRLSHGYLTIQLSSLAVEMLSFYAEILVPLVVFMAATDLLASEFQDLTIKASLMRPISRQKVLLSKISASFFMGVIYYIAIFVICIVLELIFGSSARVGINFLGMLGAYLVDLVPLFVLTLMAALINMFAKGGASSMFLCIIVYALMKYCNYFLSGSVGSVLFTSYMQWHNIWIGRTLPFGAMISKIGIVLGTGLIFYSAALILFDKKEF